MLKQKLIIILALCLLLINVRGQSSTDGLIKMNVLPPSPNSSALAKYVDFPVNQYTGIPQISLPLGSIEDKGLSIPISLSYHAGGTKVEEIASWVGLGWSLSGGGVITRTVRGLPDEISDEHHLGYNHLRPHIYDFEKVGGFTLEESNYLTLMAEGTYDSEPDQYFFNFQGRSGSIIFDTDGKGTVIPYQNIKVEKNENGFKITDEGGIEYSFQGIETSEDSQNCSTYPMPEFVSTWHIGSIKTPSGVVATFTYNSGVSYQNIIPEESQYVLYSSASNLADGQPCGNISPSGCLNTLKINTLRLQSITIGNKQIRFVSTTPRVDLPAPSNDFRLDAIEFLYNNKTTKKLTFEYDVFGCNKLRLDKIKQTDPLLTSNYNLLYKFEYNNPAGVPCVTSRAQDHWGFYNNNSPYGSLVPPGKFRALSGLIVAYPGADRTPDFAKTQTGVLNKIIYPTGGYTQFEYEQNDYGFIKDVKVQDYKMETRSVSVTADPNNQYSEDPFTVNVAQDVELTYQINITATPGDNPSINEYVAIVDVSNNNNISILSIGSGSKIIKLNPGSYKLVAYSENPITRTGAYLSYEFQTNIPIVTKPTGGIRVARITDYDGVNAGNNMIKTYKYNMSNEPARSSGVIMGEPQYEYYYTKRKLYSYTDLIENECVYYVRTARAAPLGSTQGGNVGYREVTVKRENNAETMYRYTSFYDHPDNYTFNIPFAMPTSYDYLRGLLLQKSDFKTVSGLKVPVREEFNHYKEVDDYNYKTMHGVKVAINTESAAPQKQTYFIRTYDYISQWFYQDSSKVVSYDMNGQNPITTSKAFKYENPVHAQNTRIETTKSNALKETEFTTYPLDYASGTAFIDDMNTAHIVNYPIEKTKYTTNTSGDIKIIGGSITKYKTGGKGLKDEDQAMETVAPVALSAFKLSNRASSGVLPPVGTAAVFLADPLYKSKLKVNLYDAKSNILEYQAVDGIKVSLIWDYDSSMPIAQAINAAQNDIAYTSFEAEGKGNWTFSGAGIVSGTAATGNLVYQLSSGALSKSGLTSGKTYILSYRTKNTIPFTVTGTVGIATSVALSGGWTLCEHQITGAATVQLAGTGIIDEVRLYPSDASMSTYTYTPMVGTTSQTDAKGQTTYYEYDEFQRLKNVKDQNGNIIKKNIYHYKP